jgi:hypothetical protein
MHARDALQFQRFLKEERSKLVLIARHTRGECSVEDVNNEAWVMIHELQARGRLVDLGAPDGRILLLKYLYQKLVRYTDRQVRFAERFEQAAVHGENADRNPLLNTLASDPSLEPLTALLAAEELAREPRNEPPAHESPASALVMLLRVFDNKMPRLSDYLLISVSHCYRCCAKARRLAVHQRPLRAPIQASDEKHALRPWRKFRIPGREPRRRIRYEYQKELAFD